jgi:hypothetical protein
MRVTEIEMWILREPAWAELDVVGYGVTARDGEIGSVDEATWDVRRGRIVVDTGPWIFGRKVLLPAGVIDGVDPGERTIHVACTKDQIRSAPEYVDDNLDADERYWHGLRTYWGAPGPSGPAVAPEDSLTR